MTFPTNPLDVVTELYVGGTWRDISTDVLLRDQIKISRGRADEANQADPSTCTLSIRNTAGRYSPRNPRSPFYGTFGRNTPLRVSVRREQDTFSRTVPEGWGTLERTALEWVPRGTVPTFSTDFGVDGSTAFHTVPTGGAFRYCFLQGRSYRDVEVVVSVRLPVVSSVTGGSLEPATILLRGQPDERFYQARMEITTDQAVRLIAFDPFELTLGSVVLPDLTYTGTAQTIRVRACIEGAVVRMRAWDTTGPEPRDWQLVAVDPNARMAPGPIGIRSGVAGGNANPKPVRFTYDDFVLRLPRFAGEVSSWPPRWDLSGRDVWVPITASGITRRLGQGAAPLRSPLYREMTSPSNANTMVAYWPCEDGQGATQIASASTAPPMRLSTTGVQLASVSTVPGSEPLPSLSAGGVLTGDVPQSPDGAVYYRQVLTMPDGGTVADLTPLLSITTTGTATRWDLVYGTGGSLNLQVFNRLGAQLAATDPVSFDIDGDRLKLEIELVQNGSSVDVLIVTRSIHGDDVTSDVLFFNESFPNITVGHATRVVFGPTGGLSSVGVGHVSFGTQQQFALGMTAALVGNAGETAAARIGRLTSEENVPAAVVGATESTTAMGPQRTQDLLTLLRDCGASDGGVLYEPKADVALTYRARATTYNQTASLALDYTVPGEVSPPLEPVDDDQHIRNDVEVQRDGGSSATYSQESGPLSTQRPPDGVGRYDEQVTLSLAFDFQAPDQAAWRVHIGTWDEARYPTVQVDLAAGPHLIPSATALDVRDRLTIVNPPEWLPPGSIDLLVEGYSETLDVYGWTLAYNCSPGGPWVVGILEDQVLGRADTAGSELSSSITATATTLSVATTSGPVWITGSVSPAFPFDVALSTGEVVTVTAISGPASPQTFTVTRGTNGITLAAPTGTTLSLADPMRVAL